VSYVHNLDVAAAEPPLPLPHLPRLGYVAYKHTCPEVCNAIINNMYGYNAMEVQEAFVKIKEQAKAYLDMPGEATAGGQARGAAWGRMIPRRTAAPH
jgi:hypothetical protein